jgi:murein DD-endopeptidase MepM/ murein hydrolase activator NlpD
MKKWLKLLIIVILLLIFILISFFIFNFTDKNESNKYEKLSDYVSNRNLSGMILPLKYEDMIYNHTGFWPYGVRGGSHPHGHPGFDFESEVGKPIIAVDDGKVISVDEMTPYNEQSIIIDSGTFKDYDIYYAGEIKNIQVKEGDIVKQGDIIGYFGASKDNGILLSVGILHFEVHIKNIDKGGARCPYDFMKQEAKQQLEEIFNKVNSNRGEDKYPLICNTCPEDGCY